MNNHLGLKQPIRVVNFLPCPPLAHSLLPPTIPPHFPRSWDGLIAASVGVLYARAEGAFLPSDSPTSNHFRFSTKSLSLPQPKEKDYGQQPTKTNFSTTAEHPSPFEKKVWWLHQSHKPISVPFKGHSFEGHS